jgi:hypothetical protein
MSLDLDSTRSIDRYGPGLGPVPAPGSAPGPEWSESLIEQLNARIDAPSCAQQ